MSPRDDWRGNDPAFPDPNDDKVNPRWCRGLTLREHYAGLLCAALVGSLVYPEVGGPDWEMEAVETAVRMADRLLTRLLEDGVRLGPNDKSPMIDLSTPPAAGDDDAIKAAFERTKDGES